VTGALSSLVVLAGGGTGGHVFPAQALAGELSGRGCRLALVTDRRGAGIGGAIPGLEVHRVRAGPLAGTRGVKRLLGGANLAIGTVQARRLLARLQPQAVVGFGGYASVPTMLAASFAGLPTAIHEQNALLGRANRILAARVDRIATSFRDSEGLPAAAEAKVRWTGMPVRAAVANARATPYPRIDRDGPYHILILGGSQGATVFADVMPRAVGLMPARLRGRLRLAQQCRPEDLDATRRAYAEIGVAADLSTFFDDAVERLASGHLLVARAGASTVAEVTAIGRPAILVPYPYAVDDHQSANAHALDEVGAAWFMPEGAFTAEALTARLESLFDLPETLEKAAACAYAAGRPAAAARLADVVCELLPNGQSGAGAGAARKEAA
jgi:UDP-N-acetylglucosamine--N-acetylmuramyl-(pentapeptide) pyrophosphoryl-undecaprenol N-acetylglucosamine transferase